MTMVTQPVTCPTRGVITINLKMSLPCPFCDGLNGVHQNAFLETRHLLYRNNVYLTFVYKCPNCKEGFTTTESDEASIGDIIIRERKKKQLVLEIVKSVLKIKTTTNGKRSNRQLS